MYRKKCIKKKSRTRCTRRCTRPKLEKPRCTRFGRSQPAQGAQGNTPVLLPCAGACARLVRPFALELVQTRACTRSCTRHVQDFVQDFRDFAFHIKVRLRNIIITIISIISMSLLRFGWYGDTKKPKGRFLRCTRPAQGKTKANQPLAQGAHQKNVRQHYITLHHITLQYSTVHYITLHYIHYIYTNRRVWRKLRFGKNVRIS